MNQWKGFFIVSLLASNAAVAAVQGSYEAPCAQDEEGGSSKQIASFDKDAAIKGAVLYDDLECKVAVIGISLNGTYSLDEGSLDFTTQSVELTALDQFYVDAYNQIQFCGYTDWSLNVGKEVSSLICEDASFPAVGAINYQIIKEVEGGIVFGKYTDVLDGSSDVKRPSEFDSIVFESVVAGEK